jgi:hypothetical protein
MYLRVPPTGASIDACKALGWSDAAAKSYLRGMRARFTRSGNTLSMANADAKMAFAAALARKLGLTIDAYYTTDTIPTGYYRGSTERTVRSAQIDACRPYSGSSGSPLGTVSSCGNVSVG